MRKSTLKVTLAAAAALIALPAFAQVDQAAGPIDETAIKDVNAFDATTPADVRGGGATWTGTNVGGVSFDRTFASCVGISSLGPVLGSEQPFTVDTTGAYNFSSTQDYDGYIHIYETAFDPTDAELNCVIGDDDGPGGIGTSEILGVNLTAGVQYIAVTSAFGAGDEGTFENTISGAGTVTLGGAGPATPEIIPTLSPLGLAAMLLALALVATVVLVRRNG